MNNIINLIKIVLFTTFILPAACKKNSDSSDAKFDRETARIINSGDLTRKQKDIVCSNKAMIVFVGNAEHVASGEYTSGSAQSEEKKEDPRGLLPLFNESAMRLRESLRKTNCDFENEGSVHLIEILDGPQFPDSEIRSTWYRWIRQVWTQGNTIGWTVNSENKLNMVPEVKIKDDKDFPACAAAGGSINDQKTCVCPNGTPVFKIRDLRERSDGITACEAHNRQFELHIPTQLNTVLEQFSRMDPSNTITPKVYFDQHIYLIKAHGTRLLGNGSPSLKDVFRTEKETSDLANHNDTKHLLLFDPHGPVNDKIEKSAVYSPYWKIESGCQILKSYISENKIKSDSEEFNKCNSVNKSVSQLGGSGVGELGGSGVGELGGSGVGELGGSGVGELGGSGVGELGGSGVGELGGSGVGELGGSGVGELGGSGVGELGGGKSFMYRKPNATSSPASLDKSDGNKIVSSSMSYDVSEAIEGVQKLQFPVGNDKKSPTMVVLDSCNQSGNISRSFKKAFEKLDRSLVVLSNDHAMNDSIVDYGALNSFEYTAFPHLFLWSQKANDNENYTEKVANVVNDIKKHLSAEGLDFANKIYELDLLKRRLQGLRVDFADAQKIKELADEIAKKEEELKLYRKDNKRRKFETSIQTL